MTLVANLLIAVAALLTLVVGVLVGDARPAHGADAMGLVVVPLLLGPRWLAIAATYAIAARRAALAWIHPSRSVQAGMSLAWLALAGVASFATVIEAHGAHSARFVPWAFAIAVFVPAVAIAGAAIAVNGRGSPASSPVSWRLAAAVLSAIVASGGVAMGRVEWADASEARRSQEEAEAARREWLAEQHVAAGETALARRWGNGRSVIPIDLLGPLGLLPATRTYGIHGG